MSDGMRLGTRVRTLNAAFMPEHFAPGQRAITYYWHVSHQGPGYAAQVFGNDRDAAYVLDQILHIRRRWPPFSLRRSVASSPWSWKSKRKRITPLKSTEFLGL